MKLLDFASNTYSQSGEDGIISKLLELLPERTNWCVEFGAWDGQHLSNTCNLIHNSGYSAVLIEADATRFQQLLRRYADNPRVVPLNRFVGFTPADNLDVLLSEIAIPHDFDFLSVDIDGNDYHVWRAITKLRPKIVCIEYNPTIPDPVDFVQPADPEISQGSSLLAITRLAREKGYELVCVTRLNAFYVQASLYSIFGILSNSISALREDYSDITYFFCGYDGSLFLRGAERSPWNDIRHLARIRQLPWPFRVYVGNQHPALFHAFRLYRALCRLFDRG